MAVDIHPHALTTVGTTARHVGETMLGNVATDLGAGQDDAAGARIHELATKGSLDLTLSSWILAGKSLAGNVTTTGDKFVTTANTYVSHDGKGYDEFAHVPVHRGGARPF